MALAIDSVASGAFDTLSTNPAGSNRLMLIIASWYGGAGIDTITYNGSSSGITQIGTINNGSRGVALYKKIAATTGAHDIVVTPIDSGAGFTEIQLIAINFTGADQTTPTGTGATNTGSTTTASITISGATGDTVIGAFSSSTGTSNSGSGQANQAALIGASLQSKADSKAGGSSVNLTWGAGLGPWAAIGVSVKPVATGYSLACAQGSFIEIGQVALLKAGKKVTSAQGSFTETGQSATLKTTRIITCVNSSFTETGQSAGLYRSRFLTITNGSFTETGQAVSFAIAKGITATKGNFTETGQVATFSRTWNLVSSVGTFTEIGQVATLKSARNLICAKADFSLSGQVAIPVLGKAVMAATASLALTGEAALFSITRKLSLAHGSFALNGQAASLTPDFGSPTLTANNGVFGRAGQRAELLATRQLSCAGRSIVLTGESAALSRSRVTMAAKGLFTLAGQSIDVIATGKLSAGYGSFSLTAPTTLVEKYYIFRNVANGSLAETGKSVRLLLGRGIQAGKRNFLLMGKSANLLKENAFIDLCSGIKISSVHYDDFNCPSNLGIIPNLQCSLDQHSAFTDKWDMVDLCDSDSPYLPPEDWFIDPTTTGLNCNEVL